MKTVKIRLWPWGIGFVAGENGTETPHAWCGPSRWGVGLEVGWSGLEVVPADVAQHVHVS